MLEDIDPQGKRVLVALVLFWLTGFAVGVVVGGALY